METSDQQTSPTAGDLGKSSPCCSGRWYLEFAAIMVVLFIAGGATAPHVNETHYLTKAKHYWDPSFCPGDLFLNSADAHLPFYWTVGWLTKWCSLETTAWIGRVAAWALIAAGWLRLVRSVTSARWVGPLSALVWVVLVDCCDFAGEWMVGGLLGKGGVEGKCFAYGFVLFGLTALVRGQWKAPWLWFGIASTMHPLVGGWAVLAGLVVWLAESRATRPSTVAILPSLILGGILALPGLLPVLALDRGATPEQTDEAARIYVFERLPHHLAPLELPADEFQRKAFRFAALVTAFAALAIWLVRGANASSRDQDWSYANLRRLFRFATMALIGNCIGLGIEIVLKNHPTAAARLLRYYWFRQADVIVPAAVALGAACLALHLRQRSLPWARLATAAATLLCAGHLMQIAVDRLQHPAPPALSRTDDPPAWLAACDWIREHAAPDAVCLIPRGAQSFKWYAQRADVANWKDIPQDAVGVVAWRRRLEDVFPTVEGPAGPTILSSPEKWGPVRALELAQRYGAKYIVAKSDPALGLREVYATSSNPMGGGYTIYEVDLPAKAIGATIESSAQ
jgi:hypothetical protein